MSARDWSTLATMTTMSEFEDVVLAITYVSDPTAHTVYVERRGNRYRWSIAHRGGVDPIQREIASYAGVPHDQISVPFLTVDGWAVVRPVPDPKEPVDVYGFIEPASDPAIVGARILATLRM